MADFEQHLQRQVDELPRELHPDRDLWAGIEHGVKHKRETRSSQSRLRPVLATAAGICLVAVMSWSLLHSPAEQPETQLTGNALVQSLSAQHAEQMQTLLVSVQDAPAVSADWQQQLSELDDAAKAIKTALAEDPDNTVLLRMLQNVYQQQILLVERVHAPKWQHI